jgi:hypothetical protein
MDDVTKIIYRACKDVRLARYGNVAAYLAREVIIREGDPHGCLLLTPYFPRCHGSTPHSNQA